MVKLPEEVIEPREGWPVWTYMTIFSSALICLNNGMFVGWNSPSIAKLLSEDSPIAITPSEASWLMTIEALGSFAGPLLAAKLMNNIGRKKTILIAALPAVTSWTLIYFATTVTQLYVAKFLGGLTMVTVFITMVIYIGEIAPSHIRGTMVILISVWFNLGIVVFFSLAPYMSIFSLASIGIVVCSIFALTFYWMPESPYYLIYKGHYEETEATLMKLRGRTHVDDEIEMIKKTVEISLNRSKSIRELLTNRVNRKALIIMLLIMFCHRSAGMVPLISYAHIILRDMGSPEIVNASAIMLSLIELFSCALAAVVVDKFRRKILFTISAIIGIVCLIAISAFFFVKEQTQIDVSGFTYLAVGMLFLHVFGITTGMYSLQKVLMSELFASNVKAVSNSVLIMMQSLYLTVLVKLYLVAATNWGHFVPFATFSLCSIIGFILVFPIMPETRGKTLIEIQEYLDRKARK